MASERHTGHRPGVVCLSLFLKMNPQSRQRAGLPITLRPVCNDFSI